MLVRKKIFRKFSKPLKWIESVDIHLKRKKGKRGKKGEKEGKRVGEKKSERERKIEIKTE